MEDDDDDDDNHDDDDDRNDNEWFCATSSPARDKCAYVRAWGNIYFSTRSKNFDDNDKNFLLKKLFPEYIFLIE